MFISTSIFGSNVITSFSHYNFSTHADGKLIERFKSSNFADIKDAEYSHTSGIIFDLIKAMHGHFGGKKKSKEYGQRMSYLVNIFNSSMRKELIDEFNAKNFELDLSDVLFLFSAGLRERAKRLKIDVSAVSVKCDADEKADEKIKLLHILKRMQLSCANITQFKNKCPHDKANIETLCRIPTEGQKE